MASALGSTPPWWSGSGVAAGPEAVGDCGAVGPWSRDEPSTLAPIGFAEPYSVIAADQSAQVVQPPVPADAGRVPMAQMARPAVIVVDDFTGFVGRAGQ